MLPKFPNYYLFKGTDGDNLGDCLRYYKENKKTIFVSKQTLDNDEITVTQKLNKLQKMMGIKSETWKRRLSNYEQKVKNEDYAFLIGYHYEMMKRFAYAGIFFYIIFCMMLGTNFLGYDVHDPLFNVIGFFIASLWLIFGFLFGFGGDHQDKMENFRKKMLEKNNKEL
ncbi:hypothetical protein [Helicobacter sp. 13S00482-2]|uniref:hypothetical protein n=1 Tax=Helicobacter sp. 13S00482-2 TaxID=1476200 RepID=UPI00117BB0A0|nr:hypothetical protein [Helicobacter sp. 13S00482-2]